ncbi:MAG: YidC/Oxa1 family membrane protein insertase [Anaerolineae bacterium]|nr:YidC/Oxa1 family membrane protein insertase [Anaerolineae bacterium]MDW8299802.1 YidC/Oxa1 family membrane protein insertase [Anaerolineae bacterium]
MDFLTDPFIVVMLWLYRLLGENLVLAIIVFTILSRIITYPLMRQQLKSSKRMREIAPKLQALREQYKGPQNREALARAQMELYRQEGINPMAGCLPLLIQMPILFGLYGAIYATLATTPLQFLDIQNRLLIPELSAMLPLKNQFLWMNLGQPDPYFVLPILVVVSTWLQSKIMTPPVTDPNDPSAAVSRNMTTIMPLMVGLFSISFASGLSVYWVASNIVGIVQYAMMGQVDWRNVFSAPKPAPAKAVAAPKSNAAPEPRRQERETAKTPATVSKKRKLSETMQRPAALGASSVSQPAPSPSRKSAPPKSSKARKAKK